MFEHSQNAPPRSKIGYLVNPFVAGVGSFLATFTVSRTMPSMVEAISGTRYVIIFVGAHTITRWRPAWFREDFSRRSLWIKVAGTALVIAGLLLVGLHGGSGNTSGPS